MDLKTMKSAALYFVLYIVVCLMDWKSICKRVYFHVFPVYAINGAVRNLKKDMEENPELGKGIIHDAEEALEMIDLEVVQIEKLFDSIDPKWENPKD